MGRRYSAFEEIQGMIGFLFSLVAMIAVGGIVYYFLVDVLDVHPYLSMGIALFFGPGAFTLILQAVFKRKTGEEKSFLGDLKNAFDNSGRLVAKIVLSLGAAILLFRISLLLLGSDHVIVALLIAIVVAYIIWSGTEHMLAGGKQIHTIETDHDGVEYERIRGGRLLAPWEIEARTNKLKANRSGYIDCKAFVVPQEEAPLGFAYIGAPGSGKTMSIRFHMQSTLPHIGRGLDHRALIYDAKGDMPQILAGIGIPKHLIKIFHPYDFRSVRWAMWKDIRDGKTANELASIIVPEGRSNDPIWEKLAKGLLEGVLQAFINSGKPWTLTDVCCAMRTLERIKALFRLSEEQEYLIEKLLSGGKTTRSIEMTLYGYMKPFEYIAGCWERADEEISLYEWLNQEEYIIILGHDGVEGSALERLNQLVITRIAQLVHQQQESNTRRTWLYFDELRQAGWLDLTPFATFGRSKGACLVIGLQDKDGLSDKYSEHKAQELLGMCQHKAIFALASDTTADWASKQYGSAEVLWRPETSGSQGWSISEAKDNIPVVHPADFLNMPKCSEENGHTGYYKSISYEKPFRRHLPPDAFKPPSLVPLERSIPCTAVDGISLRRPEDQKMTDWADVEGELSRFRSSRDNGTSLGQGLNGELQYSAESDPPLKLLDQTKTNRSKTGGEIIKETKKILSKK